MSIGIVTIRIILRKNSDELLRFLKDHEIGFTVVEGEGAKGNVNIVFSIVQRHDLPKVVGAINLYNPKAFYSIEDVRTLHAGIFPRKSKNRAFLLFSNGRKAK